MRVDIPLAAYLMLKHARGFQFAGKYAYQDSGVYVEMHHDVTTISRNVKVFEILGFFKSIEMDYFYTTLRMDMLLLHILCWNMCTVCSLWDNTGTSMIGSHCQSVNSGG